jgi:hypothetical protein
VSDAVDNTRVEEAHSDLNCLQLSRRGREGREGGHLQAEVRANEVLRASERQHICSVRGHHQLLWMQNTQQQPQSTQPVHIAPVTGQYRAWLRFSGVEPTVIQTEDEERTQQALQDVSPGYTHTYVRISKRTWTSGCVGGVANVRTACMRRDDWLPHRSPANSTPIPERLTVKPPRRCQPDAGLTAERRRAHRAG